MSALKDYSVIVDYCRKRGLTAMDVRGWGGLKRIDVAMKAGVNGTLTKAQWSNVARFLEADGRGGSGVSPTAGGPTALKTRDAIDKSGWGDGPWQDEPDEEMWSFGDVECRLVRHPRHGQLNGYVGLPPSHPWYEREGIDADVHGGPTFLGRFADDTFATPTNPHLWYIGFDCGHAWDKSPGMDAHYREQGVPDLIDFDTTYRTIEYVKAETENLARQAIAAARGSTEGPQPPNEEK